MLNKGLVLDRTLLAAISMLFSDCRKLLLTEVVVDPYSLCELQLIVCVNQPALSIFIVIENAIFDDVLLPLVVKIQVNLFLENRVFLRFHEILI